MEVREYMFGKLHGETVVELFARHIGLLVEAGVSYEAFVEDLRRHYEATTPAKGRAVRWSGHDDEVEMLQADVATVRSWFNPSRTVRPPLEALLSIVYAFHVRPENQLALMAEVSALMGGFFVRDIDLDAGGDVYHAGRMNKETADAVMVVADLVQDGRVDFNDADRAPAAILQINEAIASLLSHRRHIEVKALGRQ
jgi:hypothetical protein